MQITKTIRNKGTKNEGLSEEATTGEKTKNGIPRQCRSRTVQKMVSGEKRDHNKTERKNDSKRSQKTREELREKRKITQDTKAPCDSATTLLGNKENNSRYQSTG